MHIYLFSCRSNVWFDWSQKMLFDLYLDHCVWPTNVSNESLCWLWLIPHRHDGKTHSGNWGRGIACLLLHLHFSMVHVKGNELVLHGWSECDSNRISYQWYFSSFHLSVKCTQSFEISYVVWVVFDFRIIHHYSRCVCDRLSERFSWLVE